MFRRLAVLAAASIASIFLAGCAQTPGLLGSTTITTAQVRDAADAFNTVESAVIVYNRLSLCSSSPAPCRDMTVTQKLDVLVRAGVKAEKKLVTDARASIDGTVSIDDFNALIAITATLKTLTAGS